jgi:hypothetical protein
VVISLAPTLVYLFVALHRIGYPYELEWLEGGAVEIASRVAHGQAIYVAPSIHYVPYPYTPLYFWVTGTVARFTGVGFLPLRLVSLLSSLGACGLLARIVWRETGDMVAGVVAPGSTSVGWTHWRYSFFWLLCTGRVTLGASAEGSSWACWRFSHS